MRRMRRLFASPFVITIACGGSTAEQTGSVTPVSPPPGELPAPRDADMPVDDPVALIDAPVDASIVGVVRFDDPGCVRREPNGDDTHVDCPDALLPVAAPGELVVAPYGDACYRVYERKLGERTSRTVFDEGRVRCPPGGPNVKLPEKRTITTGRDRYSLDEESLTCRREVMGNPPSWRQAECPAALVPNLVGLEPDAPCSYRGVTVNCTHSGPGSDARILSVQSANNGTRIVLAVGTEGGVAPGMRVTVGKRFQGTIETCNKRSCTALVKATPDEITASGPTAKISY